MDKCNLYSVLVFLFISWASFCQYVENDWADRDTWMNVNTIFDLIQLKGGDQVADIGCHEGYLSVHLSKYIGSNGQVYAVDVRKDRLASLDAYAKRKKLKNIKTIHGDYDNPKLPKNALDAVIIMDTYHEMEDYMKILNHVKAALKTGGKLLILEKVRERVKGKSRSQQTAAHSLGLSYVKKELEETGFTISETVAYFLDWEENPQKPTWILVATK